MILQIHSREFRKSPTDCDVQSCSIFCLSGSLRATYVLLLLLLLMLIDAIRCQFDVDLPPEDSSLVHYMVFAIGAVAVLAFTGTFVFVCWWSACRRQTTLHADSKANCPGILRCLSIIIIY